MRLSPSDLAFMDDLNAALIAKTSRSSQRLLYVIAAFVLCAVVWAYFAKLDEVTVGSGKVIPAQQIQVIQNLEGGIVKEIRVREGDLVTVGQPLLAIDETRFLADFREQESQRLSLSAIAIRLKTELASVKIRNNFAANTNQESLVDLIPASLDFTLLSENAGEEVLQRQRDYFQERMRNLANQLDILEQQKNQKRSELNEIDSQIKHLGQSYDLVMKELALTAPLAAKGVVSEVELIKLQRIANDAQAALESARLNRPKLEAELLELSNKRQEIALKFRNNTQEELAEVVSNLARLNESLVSLRDKLKRTTVLSPVNGTIKTIKTNTVGGVVQPGMDLMEIVPTHESLLIEAKILPKDIAFLRPELPAVIKLTAYDYAIYGGLKGHVEHISADTITDEKGNSYYLIRVRSDESYFDKDRNALPIIPGMTASVDVMTGKKSVLSYLLKPIIRARQSALREK